MYYNTDGATVTKHIFDPITGDLLATVEGNGTATTTQYIHTDHLGGTNVVTNESGDVVETVDYYPFGEQRISEVTSGNAEQKKFTGHEFDSDTDLTYAKQRYYDQDVGRWLSQDPAFLVVGTSKLAGIVKTDGKDDTERTRNALNKYLSNPQQLNSYSYANNNPVNIKDPQGEFGASINFSIRSSAGVGQYGGAGSYSIGIGFVTEGLSSLPKFVFTRTESGFLKGLGNVVQDNSQNLKSNTIGADLGVGVDLTFTNAKTTEQLGGVSQESSINTPIGSIGGSYDTNGISSYSIGVGIGPGASIITNPSRTRVKEF